MTESHIPTESDGTGADDGLFRILFLGDVVGEPGRKAVGELLPRLKQELRADFAIVNGENSAAGRGITPKLAIGLMRAGAAVITTGDHVWDQKEILPFLPTEPRLLRPANYPPDTPGAGWVVLPTKKCKVGVINLQGRVFMNPPLDNPFKMVTEIVEEIRKETPVIFLDFHAEATSEKVAMGWHLDGKVSAVVGTHTHVPTADEWILPGGTAFQSDAGMCGPVVSVIGSQVEPVLGRFHTGMPARFGVGRGTVRLNGLLVTVQPDTGKAVAVERVKRFWTEPGSDPVVSVTTGQDA
ncbi:MAG: TIGR00282 family metallophosphoesterase [Verrucomicrobiaceae bacterium]|nr:TIGR00282 family metallophosphoesterase [Verrucomicrobiaceae bacterium]